MSTKEQSVTLLRRNKQAQVAAFNAVGMTDVTEASRASEFAKRIKWAGGLLDICLAVQRYSDKSYWYFTKDEWDSLTNENKMKFIKRGLRVRAYGHSFVLAPGDCYDGDGNVTMSWGNRKNVEDLDQRTCGAAYNDFAGAENTELILASLSGITGNEGVTGAPAAEAAKAYKAYTEEYDGIEDTSDWHLPGLGVLLIIYKCKTEIQEALEYFWSSESLLCKATTNHYYWSSTEYTSEYAFGLSFHYGYISGAQYKEVKNRVRAVCEEV
ncbi:MAG: Vir protein [Prevotella sp.]|nr:Vir protein [Prevotella sp.]